MPTSKRLSTLGVLGGVALVMAISAGASAQDTPPDIVEDHAYPNAEEIFRKQGIRLHKGNGRIMLADCGSGSDLLVIHRNDLDRDKFCFKVSSGAGFLTLEVDKVYFIVGVDRPVQATVMVGDVKLPPVEVRADRWCPVGGTGPNKATLLELRVGRSTDRFPGSTLCPNESGR